ncbi:porin [Coralliovum pocilloporae]|uniref:porin n=1 Tax=Coralliovum pocilloporae TaxID=3066369 RepID=UPI003307BBB3
MTFKSLVLGSAAALMTVGGAQAADLPAEPIDYVRVCDAYGSGFYYIPGSDTCLRVGGRIRADYAYIDRDNFDDGDGQFLYQARYYVRLDARTQTDFGLLRAYGSAQFRTGNFGLGPAGDTRGRLVVESAFIQWGGFTFGRNDSFASIYHGYFGLAPQVDIAEPYDEVNLLAYTYQLGNGFSITASLESQTSAFGRNSQVLDLGSGVNSAGQAVTVSGGAITVDPGPGGVAIPPGVIGPATVAAFDNVQQDDEAPDLVVNLNLNQSWGSANVVGALHYIETDGASGGDDETLGWAIGGGVTLNVPFAGQNDTIGIQAVYAEGASRFAYASGYISGLPTPGLNASAGGLGGSFVIPDATIVDGNLEESEIFTVLGGFQHFFSSDVSFAISGSYTDAEIAGIPDVEAYGVIGNVRWTPVSGLLFAVEGAWNRVETEGLDVNGVGDIEEDVWNVVFRVQRDF